MALKVLKFGGSSIADPECIRQVAEIIQRQKQECNLAIVVSALGGVTDALLKLAGTAGQGKNFEPQLQNLVKRHSECIDTLFSVEEDIRCRLNDLFQALKTDLSVLAKEKNLTSKSLDKILSYGELCSTAIIAQYLTQIGLPAEPLDAREVILTDDHFGHAYVHYQKSYNRIRAYWKGREKLQIITGFLGATEAGNTTTLGRSGSDYSASIFGAALNAKAIEIWTDVNGILSADPNKVSDAKPLAYLTYEEAMELAHAGAKVIFPSAMIPALYKQIPIRIKNTFEPDHPGTCITQDRRINGEEAVGISSVSNVTLIRFQGAGMVGMRGVHGRIFSSLAAQNINIILVSQAFSEHSVCFAINPEFIERAVQTLKKEFSRELENRTVDRIIVEEHLSLVAVVGEGMRHTPGIAGKVFGTLGREGINVVAIAQGSSMRNISFIVEDADVDQTLKVIHRKFFQKETGIAMIYLVGVGTIGGELLSIIERLNPPGMCIMGVASSKKMLVNDKPLTPGRAKTELINSPQPFDLETFLSAGNFSSNQKIFVDCTASRTIAEQYSKILGKGFSVVTANKIANTLDQAYYRSIRQIALGNGLQFKYETNVGAGLPIINTLQGLLNTGDDILKIEGIMSGTLSYLFSSFDGTIPFSTLVRNAWDKGFTEPDPRADLSGLDVARKILILARECGAELELENISVESLIPEDLVGDLSVDEFLDRLADYDEEFNAKRKQAESAGKVLRYVGSWDGQNGQVTLQTVGPKNPFYRQRGRENFFIFTTRRYNEVPMVIKGHGAGAAVTAAGVLADIQACIGKR